MQLAVARVAHRYRLSHIWLQCRTQLLQLKATAEDRVGAYNNLHASEINFARIASSDLKQAREEYTAMVGDLNDPEFAAAMDRTCEALVQSATRVTNG